MRDIYFHLYRRIQSNKRYIRLDNNKMESKMFLRRQKEIIIIFLERNLSFFKTTILKTLIQLINSCCECVAYATFE